MTAGKKSIFFLILMAALAVILNASPYIYQHYYRPQTDKVYVGSYPISKDKPAYLSEIEQGKEGNWKMADMYTTEPQKGSYNYLFYIGLGHAAKVLNLSAETIFFLARFAFGMLWLITIIYFIRRFVKDENQRLLAYFFAFFASGLGWLAMDTSSPDIWIPDAIPMVRFSYFPHISFANTLMLWIILLFYQSLDKLNSKLAFLAGILAFTLNIVLTFHSVLLYPLVIAIAGIATVKNKFSAAKNLKNTLIFLAVSLPSLGYMYYIKIADPVWIMVEKQNILPVPPPTSLAAGYGLMLALSVCGIFALYKTDKFKAIFFSLWIFGALLLAHIPLWIYPMQRRTLETGFYVPLAIAASFGVIGIYRYLESKKIADFDLKFKMFSVMFIVPVLLMGNIQNLTYFDYHLKWTDNLEFYVPAENVEAMKWLRDNSLQNSAILSAYFNGNIIPYYADRTVYSGHAGFTLNFEEKNKKVESFYSGKLSAEEMRDFLEKEKINYVFYSDEEKSLGSLNPDNYGFLKKVYPLNSNDKAVIYKIE